MNHKFACQRPELAAENIYIAGQKAAPGRYRLVGSHRFVYLDREDTLPASLDGKVAEYIRETVTWGEIRGLGPKA